MKHLAIFFISIAVFVFAACVNLSDSVVTEADSWFFPHFEKVDSLNPILLPSKEQSFTDPITDSIIFWEARNVLNPSAVVKGDTVYLLYRAQEITGTSRIGMAKSVDGLHFTKSPAPVFYPDNDAQKALEWNYLKGTAFAKTQDARTNSILFDGTEDPRIVEAPDGSYVMTYTSYDGKTARLCLATSQDLRQWVKHGPVLSGEPLKDTWSKSGAIICEKIDNKTVATKIDGRYWMYYGDTDLFMATSTDLIHWTPLVDEESKKRIEVLHPRRGYFDSRLVEPGPFALQTARGILLIYNASNAASFGESESPKFTYAAGQALFASDAPYKLIDRTDTPFIKPDKDFERVGEVNEVCFVEGLVHFDSRWFLYYGTADSKIAVAVCEGALAPL